MFHVGRRGAPGTPRVFNRARPSQNRTSISVVRVGKRFSRRETLRRLIPIHRDGLDGFGDEF